MASKRALAHAPWSASKVSTALRCPKLFHYRYIEKVPEPETMPETRIGKAVHLALEKALAEIPLAESIEKGKKYLEDDIEIERYQKICKNIPAFLEKFSAFNTKRGSRKPMIEFAMSITEDKRPTSFFSKKGLYRGIIDLAFRYDDDKCAVLDHKSGQKHPHKSIFDQLEGYAVLAAFTLSGIREIILGIHWVADGTVDWSKPVDVQTIRAKTSELVLSNIEAAALAVADGPRPQATSWCLRCSYRSICDTGQSMRYEPIEEEPDPYRV